MEPPKSFFLCVLFCSLNLSLCTAAWVTFDGGRLQPGLFLASHSVLSVLFRECFMPTDARCLSWLQFTFLFSNPSNRVSFSFRLKSFFQIDSIPKMPARLYGRSRACVLVSFPILQISCVSILMRWPSFSELAAGLDLAPLPS